MTPGNKYMICFISIYLDTLNQSLAPYPISNWVCGLFFFVCSCQISFFVFIQVNLFKSRLVFQLDEALPVRISTFSTVRFISATHGKSVCNKRKIHQDTLSAERSHV